MSPRLCELLLKGEMPRSSREGKTLAQRDFSTLSFGKPLTNEKEGCLLT